MKILYLMHVPWGWIKQRPHFFAEYLANDFAVDVYFRKPTRIRKKHLLDQKRDIPNLLIKGFRQIPFERIPIIKFLKLDFINNFLLRYQLPDFSQYDYVWFTCPSMFLLFKGMIKPKNKIVYDCMDDIMEFPFCKNSALLTKKILHAEQELLNKSSIVFCSSEYLTMKILRRSGIDRKVIILNNAIELPQKNEQTKVGDHFAAVLSEIQKCAYPLLYIGTISEWFDFKLMIKMLNKFKEVDLILAGPTDVKIPTHSQVHYIGTVNRENIFALMSVAWCLIMPFQITELIRSVNPVKLYEYIYSGKPIIAPKYDETMKFSQYVELYNSEADLLNIIEKLLPIKELEQNKQREMVEYAKRNTWNDRYEIIKKELVS